MHVLLLSSKSSLSPGLVGMLVGYGIAMTGNLNRLVRTAIDAEQDFSSVERVQEYMKIDAEDAQTKLGVSDSSAAPTDSKSSALMGRAHIYDDAAWPSAGRIEFANVSARYRDGLDLVFTNF